MQASLKGKVVPTERPIERLFGTSSGTVGIKIEKNLADVLRAKGYIKPDERQSMLEKDTGMLTGSSVVYASTRFIDLPGRKDTYFIEEADGTFLIPGKVPAGVNTVSINDYTLKEFRSGNNRFSYKVSLEDGTLKEGKNTYILTFDSGSIDAKPADVLTLYYERDGEKLKTVRE